MPNNEAVCKIEHHAVMFALLSKNIMEQFNGDGKEAILKAVTKYGNERGARMAQNALDHGDELTVMANQAYGEWKPDYDGQMVFGRIRTEPTLQTFISKCAWCEAWKDHDLLEYGKYYCVDIDNAVFQGFRSDFVCTPLTESLSFGGDRCDFDWGEPLTEEEVVKLDEKKKELGTTCMKDFNYHTAHLLHSISNTLLEELGENAQDAIEKAKREFADKFGNEYLEVLEKSYI
ncbi:MAG: L-2-amino-thiazoline-4-carboxylic acid hydrolase [Ruminococcus sp.]|nr:L-2-amino-thiazoline-4-carboxylic acid hydrolase [Ruminococcus sp.]